MTFEALAFLLLPADPSRRAAVIETGPGWDAGLEAAPEGADALVWGRGALDSGAGPRAVLRFALARERRLRSIGSGPPGALRVVAMHRLPPPLLRPSPVRSDLRSALLSGAAVLLSAPEAGSSVLEEAASAAGAERLSKRLHPGSGGSALIRLALARGDIAIMRVARTGGPADPAYAGEALEQLAGLATVPALFRRGETAGASWTLESVLPGRRPRHLDAGIVAQAAQFCAAMPRGEAAPIAHRTDLETLAGSFEHLAEPLFRTSALLDQAFAGIPAVLRHGDLWAGNLLVRGKTLTGVLDWDAWHPAGSPGTDLLHLIATEAGQRARIPLGRQWLERPWLSPDFTAASMEYWRAVGLRPSRELLQSVGTAWWATQTAGSLRRTPELGSDPRWVADNVEGVLSALDL